jgi:hypothetical protein
MPRTGFELTIPAAKRPEIYAFRPRGHWERQFIDVVIRNCDLQIIIKVRFQVLTAASMMFRAVFWVVLPCK